MVGDTTSSNSSIGIICLAVYTSRSKRGDSDTTPYKCYQNFTELTSIQYQNSEMNEVVPFQIVYHMPRK